MPHLRRRVVSAVLAAALTAVLAPAAVQAAPRSPDPELARPAVVGARTTPHVPAAAPATIDSDVVVYATTPSLRAYFVVAGHLELQLRSGSTTSYRGSFVDYVGNKSRKASADTSRADAPTLEIEATNGTFAFSMSSTFGGTFYDGVATSVPSKLKVPKQKVSVAAAPHLTRSASYAITLSERSGPINNPIEYAGTLTMVYDAYGRISGGQVTVTDAKGKNVTHALSASGFYSGVSFSTVAKVDKKYFGLAATVNGTRFDGYGFLANGSKTAQWAFSGTA